MRVQVVVPSDVPSIASGVLRLSLYAYDFRMADAPATQLDEDSLTFTHEAGVAQRFWFLVDGDVPPGMRTYLSVRGFERSDQSETMVLWDGITDPGVPLLVTMRPAGVYD